MYHFFVALIDRTLREKVIQRGNFHLPVLFYSAAFQLIQWNLLDTAGPIKKTCPHYRGLLISEVSLEGSTACMYIRT